jgi:WD40 repeat protein
VVGSSGKLVTYNTASWTLGPAFTGVTGQVRGVAVSADGQRVVTIDGASKLYVHAVSGGSPVTSSLAAYPVSLSLEAGSSATNIVAAVGFNTGRAETLQISGSTITALSAFTVETSNSVFVMGAAFAPTGTLLALGDDAGKLQFWTNPVSTPTPSGAALTFATKGNVNGANGLSWSRDGAYIAIAVGSRAAGGSASIYAYPARTQYATVVPTFYPVSVAFSPSGSALAIGEVTCGRVMLCAD